MDAIIFNFENLKQEHYKKRQYQKEQIIFECRQEIFKAEERIKELAIQINQLQNNIDLNLQLIDNITNQLS